MHKASLIISALLQKGNTNLSPAREVFKNGAVHSHLSLALSQKDYSGLRAFLRNNPLMVITVFVVLFLLILLTLMLALYSRNNAKQNEKLHQAYTAKSDFLSRMSHDMRTPMNGIIGLTGLTLEMENLPQEVAENLEKIDESAQYLLSLINDTLDMNKIESSKVILNKEVTNLPAFFSQMVSVAKISADQKNVNLVVTQSQNADIFVLLDKVRVQQIFFNLISNAIKFTPENGTVEISEARTVAEDAKVYTTLTIKDNGIGIDKAFLPRIFEPFEQENNTSTANYAGTGLGLAIVKNLVEIMGGTIAVKSEKGIGTEFLVTLAFSLADTQAEAALGAAVPEEALSGKRVLLCEDHPLNTQIATKLLEKKGVAVDHAENGQVAVALFAQSAPHYYAAVLMDIRMPVLDGLSAARQMRSSSHADANSVPIIAMTANAFDEDVQKSIAAGMNAHLAKPINPQQLYSTLAGLIDKNTK